MIQVEGAPPTVLRAVQRAQGLTSRARSEYELERQVARREFARVVERYDLDRDRLAVPCHPLGCDPHGECLVVCGTWVPWWRGYLAWACANHCGFRDDGGPQSRPWRWDGERFVLDLFGARQSVWAARAMYATATLAVVRQVRHAAQLDEFLVGAAIGVAADLDADRHRRSRTAMVVRAGERGREAAAALKSRLDDYLNAAAKDPRHPVSLGFMRAKRERLVREVVGEPEVQVCSTQEFLEALWLYAQGFRGTSNRYLWVGRDPKRRTPETGSGGQQADCNRRMAGDGPNKRAVTAGVYAELKALCRRYGT